MTDLERLELVLRRAVAAPNPHKKSEVFFNNFIQELYYINESLHPEVEQIDLRDLRYK